MKKLLVLFYLLFLTSLMSYSQDNANATVLLNNDTILYNTNSKDKLIQFDENVTKGLLKIIFNDTTDSKWRRQVTVTDENDKTVMQKTVQEKYGKVIFSVNSLKELANKKPLFIYTIAKPTDPALAATVRIRRVLLCKIEFKQ